MAATHIGTQICQALSDINEPGPFSCFDVLDSCPNPGLYIHHIGTVGLPLSDRDAEAISQLPACQQSPFGKGSETVVDATVRKSWQIDPEQFELRNPKFQSQINEIAQKVAKELKVACGPAHVAPQLYKLLLYEKGAFFLPHQDSEKVDGMFGTLAICLPSKHTGGDVHLSHNGKKEVFQSSGSSEFDYSYAAWYADVNHEVRPVTSGNRLVLIYNLVQTNPTLRILASNLTDPNRRLKAVLAHWNLACNTDCSGFPRFLVYKLSHEYTEAALSFDYLKGSDNRVVQQLKNASQDEDITLYLAHVEKQVYGSCAEVPYYGYDGYRYGGYGCYETDSDDVDSDDGKRSRSKGSSSSSDDIGDCHKIIDVCDSSLKLTRVIDEIGRQVAEDVDLGVEEIAQGDIFKRAPDDEEYSGYTGNEGVSTTHFYHESAVVLIPRRSMVDFKFRCYFKEHSRILSWISRLGAEVTDASDPFFRGQLTRLCFLIVQHNQAFPTKGVEFYRVVLGRKRLPDSIISETVNIALQLENVVLFEEALAQLEEPPLDLFDNIRTSISRIGFTSLMRGTAMAVQRFKHISQKWLALLRLEKSSFAESIDSTDGPDRTVKDWITDQVHASLNSGGETTADDGAAVAEIAEKYGLQMLVQHVTPLVQGRIGATAFALGFVTRLFELRGGPRLSNAAIEEVFSQILLEALNSFDLNILFEQKLPGSGPYWPPHQKELGKQISRISGERLVQILQQCTAISLERHTAILLEKLEESAITAPTTVFKHTIIPYLSSLLDHLEEMGSVTMMGQDCGKHVLRLLQQYIIRYVEREPQRCTHWTRPVDFITCTCTDCIELKNFLQAPTLKENHFTMGLKRRKHLEHLFYGREDYKTHTIQTTHKGSPHTLVVTKTNAQFIRQHAEWRSRRDIAKRDISDLARRNSRLQKLLGDQYEEIIGLKVTVPSTKPTTPARPLGERQNPSAGAQKDGKKRKSDTGVDGEHAGENKKPRREVFEVVDLTTE